MKEVMNKMKYLVDTDLVLEAILNRPRVSPYAAKAWEQINLGVHQFYITNIGLKEISELIILFADLEADANQIIEEIASKFEIIEVDSEILHKARRVSLNSKDFESAVELVCTKEYNMDAILTDRQDNFEHINSQSKISLAYQVKILDAESFSLGNEIDILSKVAFGSFYTTEDTNSITPSLVNNQLTYSIGTIIDLYIKKAEKDGGEDWSNYYVNYDIINQSWGNFQDVLNYCWERATIKEGDYYTKFVNLWNSLNRFSDIYSYWDQRILWLTRLMEIAHQNEDWANYFSSLTRKAWTLIAKNRLEEAKEYLDLANSTLPLINDISLIFRFYHCLCIFYIRTLNVDEARKISEKQSYLFVNLRKDRKINDLLYIRYEINCIGDSAKIDHLEGMFGFEDTKCQRDLKEAISLLKQAKEKFILSLNKAVEIDWTRGICYFHNKLVNINLDLASRNDDLQEKQSLIEEAEKHLNSGKNKKIFEHNLRRKAGYFLAEARLENIKISSYNGEKEAETALVIYKEIGDERKEKEAKEHLKTVIGKYQKDGNEKKVQEVRELLAKN
jgi:predicted nucleic acid-binding protein